MSDTVFVVAPCKSLVLSLLIDNSCFSTCPGDVSCMFLIIFFRPNRTENTQRQRKSPCGPKIERKTRKGLSEFLLALFGNESCVKNALLMTTRPHYSIRTHSQTRARVSCGRTGRWNVRQARETRCELRGKSRRSLGSSSRKRKFRSTTLNRLVTAHCRDRGIIALVVLATSSCSRLRNSSEITSQPHGRVLTRKSLPSHGYLS